MPTDRIGFGASPLGVGPYGLGTNAVTVENGGAINVAANGKQYGSPFLSIDPATKGQYVFDEFGRKTGEQDVRHMVKLCLATVRGTCVVPIGHKFREVRKVTDAFPQEQRVRVEEALAPVIERGFITLDAVIVDPLQGHPSVTRVFMTDKTSGVVIEELI